MLIGAGQVMELIRAYRLVWICGRFSGGKTSLAVRMGAWFAEKYNYRIVSNMKCIFNDKDVKLENDNMLHSVVIADEGGLEMENTRYIKAALAYVAKMDLLLMVPSYWAPVRAAQVITIMPIASFQEIGIPLIVYRWRVHLNYQDDKGLFYWLFPGEIYGTYSRQFTGDETFEIFDWLVEKTKEYQKRVGRKEISNRILEMENEGGEVSELSQNLLDVQEELDRFESVLKRTSSKKRVKF